MTARNDGYRTALPAFAMRAIAPWGLSSLYALYRQRQDLASLDDHLLKDIGLSKDQARQEAERPIWDVPSNWRF